jgi:hypothetical protein
VTCIVSTLKPDYNIGNIREQIDNFPFTLIPPLGSNYYYVRHASLLWLMTPSKKVIKIFSARPFDNLIQSSQ